MGDQPWDTLRESIFNMQETSLGASYPLSPVGILIENQSTGQTLTPCYFLIFPSSCNEYYVPAIWHFHLDKLILALIEVVIHLVSLACLSSTPVWNGEKDYRDVGHP